MAKVYLSRIIVPKTATDSLNLCSDVHAAHALITQGLHPAEPRYLYRRDDGPDAERPVQIIVQSINEPNWRREGSQTTMLDCASKTFGIQFAAGQVFLLHARFNCCKDDVVPGTTDKFRRIGLGSQELQMKWLQVKGEHNGFKAIDIGAVDEGTFTSPVRKDLKFRSVLFHGLIQVTDPDAFDRAFLSGIGHGKGFGFGMLSVVAVHPK